MASYTEDQLLNETPAPGATPPPWQSPGTGLSPPVPSTPRSYTEAELLNETPSAATDGTSFGRGAAVFGYGTGAGAASLTTNPLRWLSDKVYGTFAQGNAAPAGTYEAITGEKAPVPLSQQLTGGGPVPLTSEWFANQAQPKNQLERDLFGAGSAVGATAVGGALIPGLGVYAGPAAAARAAGTAAVAGGSGQAARDWVTKTYPGSDQPLVSSIAGWPVPSPSAADLAGIAASTVAPYATALPLRAGGALTRPFTESGREQTAGTYLREGAPSIPPSTADTDLSVIGNKAGPSAADLSTTATERLKDIRSNAHDAAQSGFTTADPSGAATTDVTALRQGYDDYYRSLTKADKKYLPAGNDYEADLKKNYSDQEPYKEVQQFSSNLRTDANSAYNSDPNKGRVLKGLHDALFPDGTPEAVGDPTVQANVAQAKLGWSNYKQTFEKSTLPGGGVNPIAQVTDPNGRVAPSGGLDKVLLGPTGQRERVGAFLNVADDDTKQAARDFVATRIGQLKPGAAVQTFIKNNQELINSDLFDDTQREAFSRLGTPPPVPSALPTASQLAAKQSIPGAVGVPGYVGPLLSSGLGAVAEHLGIGGGFLGEAGGGTAGLLASALLPHGGPAEWALDKLYASPYSKVTGLLTQAESDPALRSRLEALPAPPGVLWPSGKTLVRGLLAGGALPYALPPGSPNQ